jgi:predicted DNA-binding antitoxin AbrB/MazE fold protein
MECLMSIRVEAIFENGVFVPAQRPALAEHEKVRLTVDSVTANSSHVETVRRRRAKRIVLDSALAQDIALSHDFESDGN